MTAALDGRRALVTGGSRNLGAEIARQLATAGASVSVNYRSDHPDDLVSSLDRVDGAHHVAVRGDVTNPSDVEYIVEESASELGGPIDILINAVGPYDSTPFLELEVDEFDRIWDANVKSIYLLARSCAGGMRDLGRGRIVNLSAVSAFVRNRSIYTLANKTVITLTEELALELAPEILVNAVSPGQIHESLEELRGIAPEWASEVVTRTPLGRLATRAEIAGVVTLLCGPAFDSVTGMTVPVDGGLRLNTF